MARPMRFHVNGRDRGVGGQDYNPPKDGNITFWYNSNNSTTLVSFQAYLSWDFQHLM